MYARFANLTRRKNVMDRKETGFLTRQQGKMWIILVVLTVPVLSVIFTVNFILSFHTKSPNPDPTTVVQMEDTTTPTVPTDTLIAGRIDNYNGPISAYTLERAGKPVEVGFIAPVYEGDQLTVNQPDYSLQLSLGGGHQRVDITVGNSPYTVKQIGDIPNRWDNTWGWLRKKLSGYHEDKCDPNLTLCEPYTAVTRSQTHGDYLSIPLLEDHPAYMVAGTRSLYLRWFGGEPPYQVAINQDGQSIVSLSVDNQWLTTQALPFKEATIYQVVLKDTNGLTVTETFTIVPAIDYPNDLQESSLSPESRQTVKVLWLAAQTQGQWMLEAYQQASAMADQHYPARLLRNRLEKGLRVLK